MDRLFQIGDFCFRLRCPDGVAVPENFLRFAREDGEAAYTYEMELTDSFPQPRGALIARRPDLLVFAQDDLEMRYIGAAGTPGFYACACEEDAAHTHIYLARAAARAVWIDPMFLAMLSMERQMMARGAMVLHCAYMAYGDEAILFSAPSGTGKTTQATLWEKHRGTYVVNGDRALIRCEDGRWVAGGWPVCGSSGVCREETRPIRAIVMLSQGRENRIERLKPFAAFSQMYSQITINFWNKAAQQRAMDCIEQLATQVPVYHLSCTISEEAVACLEAALKE